MKPSKKSPKAKEIPKVTESEWEVLTVLWERGPVSASQITTSLKPKTGWSLGAVRTFLTRLIGKEVVRLLDDEPIYRYEAVYDQETMVHHESRTFLDRYFGGTFHALVAHYLERENLSPKEIDRLKQLLKDHER